jgi:hypothetical protein
MKTCIEKLTVAEETSASLIEELWEAIKCGPPELLAFEETLELRGLKHSAEQLLYEITALKEKLETDT